MQHVFDMEDWVDVPWTPESKETFGPVMFQQKAPAKKLIMARLDEGLSLTVAQVNMVLALHNITPKKSRLDAYTALIEVFIESDEHRKQALDRSIATVPEDAEEEAGEDESYQELLDALDESGENKNDPDLKQERAKVKKKRPLGDGTTLAPKPRGRGRGKGKGKGKGKGRGKGSGRFGRKGQAHEAPAKRRKLGEGEGPPTAPADTALADANDNPATASTQEAAAAAAAPEAIEPQVPIAEAAAEPQVPNAEATAAEPEPQVPIIAEAPEQVPNAEATAVFRNSHKSTTLELR